MLKYVQCCVHAWESLSVVMMHNNYLSVTIRLHVEVFDLFQYSC